VYVRALVKEISINIVLRNNEKLYIQLYESQRIVVFNEKFHFFFVLNQCPKDTN